VKIIKSLFTFSKLYHIVISLIILAYQAYDAN